MGKRWLPLEANPAVMEYYAKSLGGPKDIHFVDVYSCEQWALNMVPQPVYAFLFLFPITEAIVESNKAEELKIATEGQELSPRVWHMRQTIGNACGTIGLIHAIANIRDAVPCAEGGFLDCFFKKVELLNEKERAAVLEEDESIEKLHGEVQFDGQSKAPTVDEEVNLHFVAFVEKDGHLYELDGRRPFPINHGKTSRSSFLTDAAEFVKKEYMDRDPTELKFSMIAICGDSRATN